MATATADATQNQVASTTSRAGFTVPQGSQVKQPIHWQQEMEEDFLKILASYFVGDSRFEFRRNRAIKKFINNLDPQIVPLLQTFRLAGPMPASTGQPLVVAVPGGSETAIEITLDSVTTQGPMTMAAALEMALLAKANPAAKDGMMLNGSPEEQKMLAMAAAAVGLKVLNPPNFQPEPAQMQEIQTAIGTLSQLAQTASARTAPFSAPAGAAALPFAGGMPPQAAAAEAPIDDETAEKIYQFIKDTNPQAKDLEIDKMKAELDLSEMRRHFGPGGWKNFLTLVDAHAERKKAAAAAQQAATSPDAAAQAASPDNQGDADKPAEAVVTPPSAPVETATAEEPSPIPELDDKDKSRLHELQKAANPDANISATNDALAASLDDDLRTATLGDLEAAASAEAPAQPEEEPAGDQQPAAGEDFKAAAADNAAMLELTTAVPALAATEEPEVSAPFNEATAGEATPEDATPAAPETSAAEADADAPAPLSESERDNPTITRRVKRVSGASPEL